MCLVLYTAQICKVAFCGGMQVLLQPGENYSMHIDVKTRDKNVTRISISNLFSPSSAKVQPIAGL